MPNYKGHLVGGCVTYAITLCAVQMMRPVYFSFFTAAEWFACTLAGSLFPDIDIKSKGQKYFYWCILLLLLIVTFQRRFAELAVVSILAVTPMLVKHRGLFHRAWFIIAMPLAVWFVVTLHMPALRTSLLFDTIFFITGALSHLWLDLGFRKMFRW